MIQRHRWRWKWKERRGETQFEQGVRSAGGAEYFASFIVRPVVLELVRQTGPECGRRSRSGQRLPSLILDVLGE